MRRAGSWAGVPEIDDQSIRKKTQGKIMSLKITTEEMENRQLAVTIEVPQERVDQQLRRAAHVLASRAHPIQTVHQVFGLVRRLGDTAMIDVRCEREETLPGVVVGDRPDAVVETPPLLQHHHTGTRLAGGACQIPADACTGRRREFDAALLVGSRSRSGPGDMNESEAPFACRRTSGFWPAGRAWTTPDSSHASRKREPISGHFLPRA